MSQIQEAIEKVIPSLDVRMNCPYCKGTVVAVKGDVIYPHRKEFHHKKFYLCRPCEAYVGCHDKTGLPLGRLANKELRVAKSRAHRYFDPIWQNEYKSRTDAYKWLTNNMHDLLGGKPAHIGEFDLFQCQEVERLSKLFYDGKIP